MTQSKSDHNIVEIDDEEVLDVNIENSHFSDKEAIVKFKEEVSDDENELLDDPEATENKECTFHDPALTKIDLNARFAKD